MAKKKITKPFKRCGECPDWKKIKGTIEDGDCSILKEVRHARRELCLSIFNQVQKLGVS